MMLKTERLALRNIVANDFSALCAYREKPEFYKHLPQPITSKDVDIFAAKAVELNAVTPKYYWYLGITFPSEDRVIGDIVLHVDPDNSQKGTVGFGIDPDLWGQGLMSEALSAVIDFAQKSVAIRHIQTGANIGNIGSQRVLEKCGFKLLHEEAGIYQYVWTP